VDLQEVVQNAIQEISVFGARLMIVPVFVYLRADVRHAIGSLKNAYFYFIRSAI